MGRMEERLDRFAEDLITQMNTLMHQRRRRPQNQPEDEDENPFGEGDGSDSDDHSEPNQRVDNRRWESGMRVNIPEFDGDTLAPEKFIDWLVAVEEVFEFKEVPENKKVSLIATRLRGRASAWWQQLKLTRMRVGKSKVTTWGKMKKCMRANFIPHNYQRLMYQRLQNLRQGSKSVEDYTTEFYQLIARNDIQETDEQLVSRYIGGLRVQIMESVNMFDPATLSDAYQRALTFEKQNRRVGGPSFVTGGSSSSPGQMAPRPVPTQARPVGGNTGPTQARPGGSNTGLKCFNCGETGHRQSECKKAGKRQMFTDEWEVGMGRNETNLAAYCRRRYGSTFEPRNGLFLVVLGLFMLFSGFFGLYFAYNFWPTCYFWPIRNLHCFIYVCNHVEMISFQNL